jgi:Fimbrial assembly protein (PilN)
MKFQTDFALHEYRYVYGLHAIFTVTLLLLALLAVWNFSQYQATRRDLSHADISLKRVQQQTAQLESKLRTSGKLLTPDQVNALSKEIAFSNELLQRKTFFWSGLLADIEAVIPARISLKRVRVNFREGRVLLNGSAASLKDLTQFIIRLENSPAFENVFLENQKTGEHESVEFSLNAQYHLALPSGAEKKIPARKG